MGYIILILFITYFIYISIFSDKLDKKTKNAHERFVEEFFDYSTKRPNILDALPYVTISEADKSFLKSLSELELELELELTQKIQKLIELSQAKFIHLDSSITNREIRKNYGYNNFNTVLEYDTNFKQFLDYLYKVSFDLLKYDKDTTCINLLEMGLRYNSDLNQNYILLATLYKKVGQNKKIKELIDIIKDRDYLSRDKILKAIRHN